MEQAPGGQVENELKKLAKLAKYNRPGAGFEAVVPNPKLKLLDQVREVLRLRHYAIRTEQSYSDWVRRYIKFHKMRSREELFPAEPKIELFLSDLAINGQVAASTQNQAFNALLFLYRDVLHQQLENIQAVRADRPVRVPTVLTPEEVKQVIQAMSGTPQLVVKLLYGSGLRLLESLRLRVKDLDFNMKQLTVRDGKGARDRFTSKSATRCGCTFTPFIPNGAILHRLESAPRSGPQTSPNRVPVQTIFAAPIQFPRGFCRIPSPLLLIRSQG
jgi:integrase